MSTTPEDGGFRYQTADANAWITIGENAAAIYEFSSIHPGQGGGRRALIDMKRCWQDLTVVDPGSPGTEARGFWDKMVSCGLVDRLLDEDGDVLATYA